MTQKPTPGPWVLEKISDRCFVICGANKFVVAEIGYMGDVVPTSANARLMASAPELLALLKRYRSETPLGRQPHMIASEADEIIARAEGRATPTTSLRGE